MLEAARRELRRMRESTDAWQELRHDPDQDGEDRNALRRARVLWALQYDHGPGDLALVRLLAEQEAELNEETGLAGFLLAGYRQVEDVWLHWEIKSTDFDTWCGYGMEHLVAAGVQRTIDFVRESTHPDRDDVLEYLLGEDGRPELPEEELAEWFEHRRATFPADPADENEITWVARAMRTGDPVLARQWLDRWAAGRPRDKDTLDMLHYQLTELGAFAEAAAVQRERLPLAWSTFDSAARRRDLASLERRAGDLDAAWAALRECRRILDDVPGWTGVGLGRTYVEELFRLAAAADGDLSATVFAEADRQARDVPDLPLMVLQAAADAAGKAGDEARAEHYRALGEAERLRIDLA
ncbi:hypothetical protein [Actinoplanes sp. NPDC049802]|uniref:hypothetical protein n=1 Tax=Actinoplanes sp. NPDC049802 TaxID=3154742 RepID=UPI00340F8D16